MQSEVLKQLKGYTIYPASVDCADGTACAIVRSDTEKKLAVAGDTSGFEGTEQDGVLVCDLSVENAKELMRRFPYTAPISYGQSRFTFGLGDRLGLATPGHVRTVEAYDVFPIFAQQSIRELNLTGRTFPAVIADAAFGVFQEGYKKGYGADGDHLKTFDEIRYAIESGCSMITLDCSEHIQEKYIGASDAEVAAAYAALPEDLRAHYEARYLGTDLPFIGAISPEELQRDVLIFYDAVDHAKACYDLIREIASKEIDIELSIDETYSITSPLQHLIVSTELYERGVKLASAAPHFSGQFEKGIEFQGNLADFVRDLEIHQKIADRFGYKLSLHSGSDKLSVYPAFGRITGGHMHVKTAGTNWLEGIRILAEKEPALYRKAQKYALEHYDEAAKYYHVSTDPYSIPDIDLLSDAYLPELLNRDASRQLMHIAYGLLLSQDWFKTPFYEMMFREEEAYYAGLQNHIGKHLKMLTKID